MSDRPGRWPHRRFTEPIGPGARSEDFLARLAELCERAGRLQEVVEQMLLEARMPTILVVEDDPVSREALGGILTGRGWIVAEAATLAAGLAGLEPEPTCVILDLMLPDGDGSMILHAARSSGLKTRFVVTTGVDDPNRLQALARLEPDALLQKPVAFEDLYQACLGPGSGV